MTSALARYILTAPKFGDPNHIAAVHYLEDVVRAREALARCVHGKCPRCHGYGCGPVIGEVCDSCGGTGHGPCACFAGIEHCNAILEAAGRL